MRIEDYFQKIKNAVEASPIVYLPGITYEKRGTYEGFIRGRIRFIDNSILFWREFIDVEIKEDRLLYVYQYMECSKKLIFRYDNTGHHKKLNLPTYPHHKHEGTEDNVIPSEAVDLAKVLQEIELLVKLPID